MTTPAIPGYTRRKMLADIEAHAPASPDDTTLFAPDAVAQAGKHPLGFNVRPGANYGKLLTQVKAMGGCEAMLFHCDHSALHNLHAFKSWVDVLIWRPNEWVGEEIFKQEPNAIKWVDDRHFEITNAGFTPDDLWLHLHNEAGWSETMLQWEATAITWGGPDWRMMKFVALNEGVGNPNEHQVHKARPILELAAKHPDRVLIGTHDGYFPVMGDRGYPWLQGRWQASSAELNGGHSYESYRQSIGLGPIRYVMTEAGGEDIPSERGWTSTLPRNSSQLPGPFHASDAAWQKLYQDAGKPYPGKDAAYLEQIEAAWNTGKWGDPRIVGRTLFSWGS